MKKKFTPSESKLLIRVGVNIRNIRKAAGFSQEGLALECEVDRSYMGRIERGKNNTSMLILKRVADTLKVDILEFFRTKGK